MVPQPLNHTLQSALNFTRRQPLFLQSSPTPCLLTPRFTCNLLSKFRSRKILDCAVTLARLCEFVPPHFTARSLIFSTSRSALRVSSPLATVDILLAYLCNAPQLAQSH